MTESEYWRDYELIRDEVNIAIESFYTYLEVHRCAAEDENVYLAFNENPTFWAMQRYSLQTTFFIALGRIFDHGKDSHSIHKLLTSTINHQDYFSKAALAKRKTNGESIPDWLDDYLVDVFVPSSEDLKELKRSLKTHTKKFESTYRDIRNNVFAHRILKEQEHVSDLFENTQIKEIDEILYFLYDLLIALRELFQNGTRPELGISNYDYKDRVKKTTRAVLGSISINLNK
jgi:hypothetical protein